MNAKQLAEDAAKNYLSSFSDLDPLFVQALQRAYIDGFIAGSKDTLSDAFSCDIYGCTNSAAVKVCEEHYRGQEIKAICPVCKGELIVTPGGRLIG